MMPPKPAVPEDETIAKTLHERRVVEPSVLRTAIDVQRRSLAKGRVRRLLEILVETGEIDPDQVDTLTVDADGDRTQMGADQSFGRYRLDQELGRGGMGVVWKAWDRELERTVALKQILFQPAQGTELVERFLGEARAAAKLRHPNIVTVYDVGVEAGTRYPDPHVEGVGRA